MIIHWFRRDLRLTDNPALFAAHRASGGVVAPVFVLSDWKHRHGWTGSPRQEFLGGTLAELAVGLERLGGKLLFRQGRADLELERLLRDTGATALYFNRDRDPVGREMETRVEAMTRRCGAAAIGFDGVTAHPFDSVLTRSGEFFRVFTPYSRAWMQTAIPSPLPVIGSFAPNNSVLDRVASLPAPGLAHWGLVSTARIIAPGETAARKRMDTFFRQNVHRYAAERDCPAAEVTSR